MVDGPSLQGPRTNNLPDPMSDLVQRLVQLRRDLNDVTSAILKSAGIEVSPDGMTINSALDVLGTLDVAGTLDVSGTANVGGQLNVTGDALFSGNLSVPNGSITNAALANPVTAQVGQNSAGYPAFTIPTSWGDYATVSIPVPTGFTSASVMVMSTALLSVTTTDAVQYAARISGADGPITTIALSSQFDSACAAFGRIVPGLSGGSITASARLQSSSGIAMAGAVNVVMSATFYR